MSQLRFNHAFVMMMVGGTACAFLIPPRITERAKGKADVLLYPIVRPVRGIADSIAGRWGEKKLPAGERPRGDGEISRENIELKQQVVFLTQQLEDLRLVEAERKRLGPLLKYFKPVTVIGADSAPNRESLSVTWPVTGADNSPGAGVMWAEGLAGKFAESGRVRLVTDPGFTVTAEFGRWENGQWQAVLPGTKASVKGVGNGTMKVDHLAVDIAKAVRPGDWVIVSDPTLADAFKTVQIGQVESNQPVPSKPLFAEIIVKPRTDLKRLKEVLVLKK